MMLDFGMNCIAPKPIIQYPEMMGFALLYPSYRALLKHVNDKRNSS